MKRLLATGGHGFVGRAVQSFLASAGNTPRIECTIPSPDFDLLDPRSVDDLLAAAQPQLIMHLAAQSNVHQSFSDPEGALRVNAIGTLRLLEGLKRARASVRTLIVSSGDVYGFVAESEMPVNESRVARPLSPYGVSKLTAEALSYQWAKTDRLPLIIARPFNHVGAGQSDGFVLPAFARQIAEIKAGKRDPVIMVGDIDTTRDFTHVADIVEAYFLLLEKGEPGEIYNVCSGIDHKIRDLLERMLEIAGIKAEIRRDLARFRPAEQRVMRGDNAKISRLGWAPKRSIDEALSEILADWEQRTRNG